MDELLVGPNRTNDDIIEDLCPSMTVKMAQEHIPEPSTCILGVEEPSPLLALPYEIRRIIYCFAFNEFVVEVRAVPLTKGERPVKFEKMRRNTVKQPVRGVFAALSRANRQLSSEVGALFWDKALLYLTDIRLGWEGLNGISLRALMCKVRSVVVYADLSKLVASCSFTSVHPSRLLHIAEMLISSMNC